MTVTVTRWRDDVIRHLRLASSIRSSLEGMRPTESTLEPLKTVLVELARLKNSPPGDISYSDLMALLSLREMLKRFPPVDIGGLFYFVGEKGYRDRATQIESIVSLLADAEPPGALQASPSDRGEGESPPEADTIQTAGENKSPAAPAFPDPLNQTLGKLKGSSAAKNLIRFLAHQTDQKATLVDTARHRNSGRREPTRRNISSTKQQVRRTAANLELRDAPLRIEYCWIQQIISLVDRNGNPPAFHINEIADVAK